MCGIFGYIGKRNEGKSIVLAGLKTLEYRGYDSWGIAVLNQKSEVGGGKLEERKIIVKKKAGRIGDASVSDLPNSNFALGHTRWATHGGVTDKNAHPHLDCTGNIAIIHNGIIENYEEIKKELLDKGHKFVSETDSEVAVHLIEENYKKLKAQSGKRKAESLKEIYLEAVREAFNRFIGLNAIIVMDTQSDTFVAAKNGSPLVIGRGKEENFIASDAHALLPYTKDVYFMEDQELVLLARDTMSIYEAETGKEKTPKFSHLTWDNLVADKGQYPHFMLKEIYDQPKVIERIASDSSQKVKLFVEDIQRSYGTYLVGCGSAAYACLAGTYIFSKIAKKHLNYTVASEFGYISDFITAKTLVLALSQSGETIDVIESVKKAREKGAKVGTLVNVLGSTLYRISDLKLLLGAGVEKAVVSTKAFTAKLAYLILLANATNNSRQDGRKNLAQAASALKKVLSKENIELIKKLVVDIFRKEHIYVVGRGLSYPIALESALKIKEASYIHAEGFAAGELKHGPISLIEKNTPCLVFFLNDETYSATFSSAMEMKARGGYIIGVSFKPHEKFDYYLPILDCGIASVIVQACIGQLLGYYLSIARGLDPDKPRNLAKSVTVK